MDCSIWQKLWSLGQFRMRLAQNLRCWYTSSHSSFCCIAEVWARDVSISNAGIYQGGAVPNCLFKSNRLGVWLFMSEMPYGTLSSNMLWRLFFVMHCADNEHLEQLCSTLQPADYKQRLKGKIPTHTTNSNPFSCCCISYGFNSAGCIVKCTLESMTGPVALEMSWAVHGFPVPVCPNCRFNNNW